jgi:hypothetical protein
MALTTWKWSIGLATACALVWFWLFQGQHPGDAVQPFAPSALPAGAATSPPVSADMNRATERLRLLQIRDSLVSVASKSSDGLTVMIAPGYGAPLQRALETKLRDRWSRLRTPAKLPVVIAAVIDSASTVAGFPRRKPSVALLPITTFLPGAATASRCVSVVRIPVVVDARSPKFIVPNLLSPETIDGLLSPCIYYAAFGTPGPGVERWLRDGGWRAAHHTEWWSPAPRWSEYVNGMGPLLDRLASRAEPSWQVRWVLSVPGVGCLGGESGRCLEAATTSQPTQDDSVWRANVVSSNGTNQFSFYRPWTAASLGPYDGWLVSEMVRSLGPERFSAFWQSRAPVSDAFRAASGEELDDWIRDWGNRIYGSIAIGPGLPFTAVIAGLLVFGLSVLTAVSIARRRRVN